MGNHTKESLEQAVKTSFSVSQVLTKLGLKPAGGNYATIKSKVKKFGIDCSHFSGQGYLKGKNHDWARKVSLEDIFNGECYTSSHRLKNRLIKEGVFERKCYKCQNREWLGQPIAIELEHIDGKHENNSKENLTLLCPNCHAQTESYRGKNKSK
jgi:Zn finger protein HypA/HybF involved in hydrogenase expression